MIRQASALLRRKDSQNIDDNSKGEGSSSSCSSASSEESSLPSTNAVMSYDPKFVTTGGGLLPSEETSSTTTTQPTSSCLLLLAAPAVCAILGVTLTPKFLVLAVVYLIAAARPLLVASLEKCRAGFSKESTLPLSNNSSTSNWNAMVRTSLNSHRSLTVQFSMLAICLFLYERSRVLVVGEGQGTVHVAFGSAKQIILAEHALGLDVEPYLQSKLLSQEWLIAIANVYYAVMHFVVPFGAMACLVVGNRDINFQHRSSFFLMLALALVIFVVMPTMPPRLLERYRREYAPEFDANVAQVLEPYWSIVDTMAKGDTLYDKLHKEGGNPYAAMPSMHTGWALWSALVVMDLFPRKLTTWLAMGHVFFTIFFIILTGNHFWLDAVGGALCVLVGRRVGAKVTHDSVLQPIRTLVKKRTTTTTTSRHLDNNKLLLRSESSSSSNSSVSVV